MTADAPRDRFQILSLDGGGIRGIFSAALLAGLERDLGGRVLSHFDLVVGTSTGGIIAAALGAGDERGRHRGPVRLGDDDDLPRATAGLESGGWSRPKYRAAGLRRVLRGVFGDRLLGESRVPLVIPSFDLGENRRLPVQDPAP